MGATTAAEIEPSTSARARVHFEDVIVTNSRTTDMAHTLWRAVMRPGDTAVDATMGNGWDTVALALMLADLESTSDPAVESKPGRVVAFDIQEDALTSTRTRMDKDLTPEQASRVDLVLKSHDMMEEHVREHDSVGVVCFNCGYLPGPDGNKVVRTATTTTCLLYTSPSPRDRTRSRMPSSA